MKEDKEDDSVSLKRGRLSAPHEKEEKPGTGTAKKNCCGSYEERGEGNYRKPPPLKMTGRHDQLF